MLDRLNHELTLVARTSLILWMTILYFACQDQEITSSLSNAGSVVFDMLDSSSPEVNFPAHWPERFDLGQIASLQDIQRWDIDIMPDGAGLPFGGGTKEEGKVIYDSKCVACHGQSGVEGPFDKLVGREPKEGFPFGQDYKYQSMRTIGNYWPYATTLFDYIRRSMPQNEPGSLTNDEVYALCAYLLLLNEIIPAGTELDARSLPQIIMPARDRFVNDNRRGGAEVR